MNFVKTPERYMMNAKLEWKNNTYRNPGWHFFEDVKTSKSYNNNVKATFNITNLKGDDLFMQLHIPGFKNREYTQVKAPITFEAPKPYDKLQTPTLVIRNEGEAWKNPFVVIYEPFNENEKPTITSVSKIEQEGIYKGLKVDSETTNGKLVQYIITQSKGEVFKSDALDIYFIGTFAIITLNEKQELQNIYIGKGEKLLYKGEKFITDDSKALYKILK